MKKLYVIDAMCLFYQAYHAYPNLTSKGRSVGGVYGVATFLERLVKEKHPDYLIIANDTYGKTFRHKMYPEYKANREEKSADFLEQLSLLKKMFKHMNIPLLEDPEYEADDFIGSITKKYANDELHCYIVSRDKDFMQLVNKNVSLFKPVLGGEEQIVGVDGVIQKFGVRPEQVVDVLALMGDTADNVPGVKGIGSKGAAELINGFGNVENLCKSICITKPKFQKKLLGQEEVAKLSKSLVIIKTDIEVDDLEAYALRPVHSTLMNFFLDLEFHSIVNRIKEEAGKPI